MKPRFFFLVGTVLTVSAFAGACGDDDDGSGVGGTGGTAGSGGASGLGGAGGAGGQGGAAGQGGGEAGSGGVPPAVRQIEAGGSHTCVLLGDGGVRCWGSNFAGQLGYGHKRDIGDDEAPSTAGTIDLGGKAVQISVGAAHSCALLESGSVRCWGQGDFGRLGYGNVSAIGDDETPASVGPVELGERAQQISAGGTHTCALLESGGVLCWGSGVGGLLGYGNADDVGDNETPASVNRVQLGGKALRISAGASHSCALLEGGAVRCWGSGAGGLLGYASVDNVGDNETPDKAGPVELGERAIEVVAANTHSCARLESGLVRCWGPGDAGPLGYGDESAIGDTEAPSTVGPVDLGGKAVELTGGFLRSCARLEDGAVRCWGSGQFGGLGYGNTDNVGDNEVPSTVGPVDLGGKAEGVSAGFGHVCALLEGGAVRCWGRGVGGALGYGNTDNVGDNETPSSIDAVRLF